MTKKVTLVFVALLFFGISGAAHAQTNSRMYAPAPTASAPCLLNASDTPCASPLPITCGKYTNCYPLTPQPGTGTYPPSTASSTWHCPPNALCATPMSTTTVPMPVSICPPHTACATQGVVTSASSTWACPPNAICAQPMIPFTHDLKVTSSGTDVTTLQNWLLSQGYSIPAGATGHFGIQTKAALKAFQSAKHIPATGYFGSITRAAIHSN